MSETYSFARRELANANDLFEYACDETFRKHEFGKHHWLHIITESSGIR